MILLGDTPYTPCFVRNEFLFDEKRGHGEFTPAVAFAFRAEPARVPMFQVMLDSGAQWARVPVHMICSKPCDPLPVEQSCWWDSYGYEFTVIALPFLKTMRSPRWAGMGRSAKGTTCLRWIGCRPAGVKRQTSTKTTTSSR